MVKLVAAGVDLRIPAGEYHVATPDDVAYADLAALCAEAMVHGGCVGQLDPMFEGDEPTYVVVLRVDAAALVLERGGTTLALAGAASESAPFIAFASDSTFNGPTLGPTSFVLGYRDDRGDQVWEGDGWTIRRHPFAAAADGRAWPWRGSGSFGPYSLTVHLEATSDEIERFLTAATPLPYTRTEPERYELADVGRLVVDTGILHFLRAAGRGQAEDHVESFDRGLLLALARGALGPLHWVAFEHDWEAPFAIGDDGASLAAYLVGDRDPVEAIQRELLEVRRIDLTGVPADRVASRLAAELGATEAIDDAALDAWLAARDLAHFAHHVLVEVDELASWYERLHAAQPRVVWQLRGVR